MLSGYSAFYTVNIDLFTKLPYVVTIRKPLKFYGSYCNKTTKKLIATRKNFINVESINVCKKNKIYTRVMN